MLAVALLMGTLAALGDGRIYDRCELARDLQSLGVPRDQVATWVCIAYHESRYDTAARNYGSGDHGLLQISELYWCGPGKACGAPCSAFRDDDITDDVRCALQIYKEHTRLQGNGFLAWVVYPQHCNHNAKKYIVNCNRNYKSTKFDDRDRALKTSDKTINEFKPQVVNNTYSNPVTPKYLSINSIFQGSYVNDFERNYYDNNKQSNWLNFKVDNIDDLHLPGVVSANQRSRITESTTLPTPVTTLDPDLVGIKPPMPRRIESNQFRRRKTFSEPLFLKNKINNELKSIKTTPAPVRQNSESSSSIKQDLSHNIFLNLSPSVVAKSLREFSPQEIKSTDLSRYHVKSPEVEESSSSTVLTYDDLAQNPFLNSLTGLNFKSRTESPFRATDFAQNNFRGFTSTTSRPVVSIRSSKQIGVLHSPEVYSTKAETSKSSLQTNEDDTISIADLAQNPFLSRLLNVNNIKPSPETKFIDAKEIIITTTKPIMDLEFSSPIGNLSSHQKPLEISTKIPTTLERGRALHVSHVDKTSTTNPVIENSSTYSTRRYQTISRHRSNINQDNLKSTTPVVVDTYRQKVTSTAKPYTNDINRRNFKIETTTSKTTSTSSDTLNNVKEVNKVTISSEIETIPHSINITEIARKPQIMIRPETASSIRTIDGTEISNRSQVLSNTEKVSVSQAESRPQTTSRLQTSSTPEALSGLQTINETESASRLQTTRAWRKSFTTSKPQTTSRLPSTSRQETIKRIETTSSRPLSTSKPQTITAGGLQTTSRPESTSGPTTTLRIGAAKRFPEEPRNNISTTPGPSFTWNRLTNPTAIYTTRHYSTSTAKPRITEASTAKTTLSVFDLYLRPSTQTSFKPFEFSPFNGLRKGISIFSGGTTKSPPTYFTDKHRIAKQVPRN